MTRSWILDLNRFARGAASSAIRGYFDPADKGRLVEPRFLSVAYETGNLSREQCWDVAEAHRRRLRAEAPPPLCGHLAVELGLMTPNVADEIVSRIEVYAREGRRLPDPLAWRPGSLRALPRVLYRASAALALSVIFVVTGLITAWDWRALAAIASIAAGIWLTLESSVPSMLRGYFSVARLFRALFAALLPVSLAYCAYLAYGLYLTAGEGAAEQLWQRMKVSGAVCVGGVAWLLVARSWRVRAGWIAEARFDLFAQLVGRVRDMRAEVVRGIGNESRCLRHVSEVLGNTGAILSLNPWGVLLKRAIFWKKRAVALTLWYAEPNEKHGAFFDIKCYAAPGAPGEVLQGLEEIRRRHRPVQMDEERFRATIHRSIRPDGRLDRRQLMRNPEKAEFVSLTGFVWARQQPVMTGDAFSCLAFDQSYVADLGIDARTPSVLEWLRFRSIAAFPVHSRREGQDVPKGVLAAFKNVPNGFDFEDYIVLRAVAQLIADVLPDG